MCGIPSTKSLLKILILFVLPFLLFLSTCQTITKKTYNWYGGDYDPPYSYLFNSLNNAMLYKAGNVDNPGTPVQFAGAYVIRMYHLFDFKNREDIQVSVLKDPEKYIHILTWFFALINCLVVFGAGYLVFRLTGLLLQSVFLQFSVFLTPMGLFHGMIRVSQEMTLFTSAFVMVFLLYLYLKNKISLNRFIIFIALVSGFGISSKLTFVPFLLTPLIIIPKWKNKLKFFLFSFLSFIIFTLPIIRMYDRIYFWVQALLTHTGWYGTGEKGFINTSTYISDLFKLITVNPVFLISLLLGIIFLIIFRNYKNSVVDKTNLKVSFAVLITQIAGILLIAKQPSERYLMPYEVLSGLQILILFDYLITGIDHTYKKSLLTLFFIVLLIFGGFRSYMKKESFYSSQNNNEYKVSYQKFKQISENDIKVFCLPSSSIEAALYFGSVFSGGVHALKLTELYANTYFIDISVSKFKNWDGSEFSFEDLIKNSNKKIYFLTLVKWADFSEQAKNEISGKGFELKDIYFGKIQTIYQLLRK
jgi:hypothetical protein